MSSNRPFIWSRQVKSSGTTKMMWYNVNKSSFEKKKGIKKKKIIDTEFTEKICLKKNLPKIIV